MKFKSSRRVSRIYSGIVKGWPTMVESGEYIVNDISDGRSPFYRDEIVWFLKPENNVIRVYGNTNVFHTRLIDIHENGDLGINNEIDMKCVKNLLKHMEYIVSRYNDTWLIRDEIDMFSKRVRSIVAKEYNCE